MFPLIAAAAKFLMPMVTKALGSMMSGGLSGILGKLGNFGDLLGGLTEKAQEARQEADGKMKKAQETATAAKQQAENFLENAQNAVKALPVPAFNLI